jgi:1-acyl-sn-glycerol-3-phosphate acyltransferase
MSQSRLLAQVRFAPLFWTQFLGALNDNVYRNALLVLFTARLAREQAHVLVQVAGGIFILPYFLFSATAGMVADRGEKSRLVRWVKLLEIGVMAFGAVALAVGNEWMLLGVLFFLGVQATLFGPLKYSILPQHLAPEELVGGNGLVEMGTFVAILLGTVVGGLLAAVAGTGPYLVGAVTITIAIAGWLASRKIPTAPATDPGLRVSLNVARETWRTIAMARDTRSVFLSILGISWFWLYGALVLAQFPDFARWTLGGDEHVITVLLTVFSIGVGAGSLVCERLSFGQIELGLVPIGSVGLSLFAVDLFFATHGLSAAAGAPTIGAGELLARPGSGRILLDLVALGFSGGLYCVPLYAMIQDRANPAHRSRIIAANNVLNAVFMVAAAACGVGFAKAGLSVARVFLFAAVANAAVAVYIYALVPEFVMRLFVWALVHVLYRARSRGVVENVPRKGPCVVVCNHVSFVDALVVGAAVKRPVRFVMDHRIFRTPVLGFVFRTAKAIPIAPARENAALMERAFDEVRRALADGDVVGLFPEGKITKNGEMNEFRPGIERIVRESPVPVVPLALRGLWGSFFSRVEGSAMKHPFRRGVLSRIELVAGEPVPAASVTAKGIEDRVRELRGAVR